MKREIKVTTFILDIGEFLLSNGWDHHVHKGAGPRFWSVWTERSRRGLVIESRLIYTRT